VLFALLAVVAWTALGEGAEYASFPLDEKPAYGDGLLHVVRVDPAKADLRFGLAAARRPAAERPGDGDRHLDHDRLAHVEDDSPRNVFHLQSPEAGLRSSNLRRPPSIRRPA
jgi:hypothetical protein